MSLNFKRRAQSLKRVKKKASGTPGRKGRPKKRTTCSYSRRPRSGSGNRSFSYHTSYHRTCIPTIVETAPLVPAEPQTEPVPVETISEKLMEEFLIEDLGPDEEEDIPQKSLIIDTGICRNFLLFSTGGVFIN